MFQSQVLRLAGNTNVIAIGPVPMDLREGVLEVYSRTDSAEVDVGVFTSPDRPSGSTAGSVDGMRSAINSPARDSSGGVPVVGLGNSMSSGYQPLSFSIPVMLGSEDRFVVVFGESAATVDVLFGFRRN